MGRFTSLARGAARHTFSDRRDAGRVLADALGGYRGASDLIVLGLPRGGVPVAWEVAAALHAPLDVLVVRKLGAPRWQELALGAIASGGGSGPRMVLNDEVVHSLHISDDQLEQVIDKESTELARREEAYRAGRPPLDLAGKTVILVDDGIATGASMLAAVQAIRSACPAKVVVAVPVAPPSAYKQLARTADDVISVAVPASFMAVGEYYDDFTQTSDDEVRDLLAAPTTG